LFATFAAHPRSPKSVAALGDTNVVLHAVNFHLFKAFPTCIENCHFFASVSTRYGVLTAIQGRIGVFGNAFGLWQPPCQTIDRCAF
jgi:hypothetical protein